MLNEKYPLCQIGGCHLRATRAVEIDLPAAWEATREYTTLTVVVGLCASCAHDVSGRVQALLEARTEFHSLIEIIEQATRYEKAQQLRLEAVTDQADRYELEAGALRQQLQDTEAELRQARGVSDQVKVAALSGTVAGYRRALAEAFNSGDGSYRP